jgi:hypothetical protein
MTTEQAKALAEAEVKRLRKRVSYFKGRATAERNKHWQAQYIRATQPRSDEAFLLCDVTLSNMLVLASNYDASAQSEAASLRHAEERLASLLRSAAGDSLRQPLPRSASSATGVFAGCRLRRSLRPSSGLRCFSTTGAPDAFDSVVAQPRAATPRAHTVSAIHPGCMPPTNPVSHQRVHNSCTAQGKIFPHIAALHGTETHDELRRLG